MENFFNNPISENLHHDRYEFQNEGVKGTLKRIADNIFPPELYPDQNQRLFEAMSNHYCMFGGRVAANIGLGSKLTLNNCFTSNYIKDSMEDIFEHVKYGALVQKFGGGIGYSYSTLRPKGTPTSNHGIASGVISFMTAFNAQTHTVVSMNRRGAQMAILDVYHPDIYDFIDAKQHDTNTLQYFNMSVMVDDAFLKAVDKNEKIALRFPVYDTNGNLLPINDPQVKIYEWVDAKELWDKITFNAYNTGEPGVFFRDNINNMNPLRDWESAIVTNPCGEFIGSIVHQEVKNQMPGEYGGSCNLGSLYLHNFVKHPFTNEAYLDLPKLHETIEIFVEALDRIIDINYYPLEMFENYQKMFRTIGLGITGLADMLVMLGIDYRSQHAKNYVKNLMNDITYHAYLRSVQLAEIKGEAPWFCFEKEYREQYANNEFLNQMIKNDNLVEISFQGWAELVDCIKDIGIRNTKIISIAPVGTGSLVWGNNCSSGIEPIFSLEYTRQVKIGGQNDENKQEVTLMDFAWKKFKEEAKKREKAVMSDADKLEYEIWYNKYRSNFITALEMTPEEHVDMLGTIAPYVDMSISKTINIPTDYSFEATKNIYRKCHELGIKGCTIFRPNEIRQGVLISDKKIEKSKKTIDIEETKTESLHNQSVSLDSLHWGDTLLDSDEDFGKRRKLITGCGSLHVTSFFNPESSELVSTYLNKGSTGGCNNFMIGLSRMISAAVKRGMTIEEVVDQLSSCGVCPSYAIRTATKGDTSKGSSCPVAVGYALEEMYREAKEELNIETESSNEEFDSDPSKEECKQDKAWQTTAPLCPECGEPLIMEGGCNICKACGYSKCG